MFSIPEMISHLTSRPAKRLNVYPFRGHIAVGSAADLVLFDPDAIQDMATFEEPKMPSRGVRFVLVNGEVALDEGALTGARGGHVLRRAKDGSIRSVKTE
jgi:N-acyl-D-aspartate/D-glutamate deacylase